MKTLTFMIVAMTAVVACATDAPPAFEMRITTLQPSPETDEITLTNKVTKATEIMHVHKTPVLDVTMIRSASVQTPENDIYSYVEVVFTDAGRDRLASVTRQNIERRIVIFVDGTLVVAPIIKAEITGGILWLSGRMSNNEATEIADKINKAVQ